MAEKLERPSFLGRLFGRSSSPPSANGNGSKSASGVVLGPGVIPGIDFFSPDGTRTIIRIVGGGSSEAERVSAASAYTAAAYAYVAMRWRASRMAEPPLMVVEEDAETGDEEWLPKHPLAPLLENPSPDFDMGELLFRTSLYVDQTGAALWTKDKDGRGMPGRLAPFSQDEFEVESTRDLIRGVFKLKTARGPRDKKPEEVIYFHEPDPGNWLRGLSRLEVFLGWLNLGQVARATVRDLLANAVWPSVILQPDAEWNPTDDELKEYKGKAESYALPGKRGKPFTMLGGGTATVVSARIRDLIPDDILDRVESVTAAVFGVPAVVLQYLVGLKNSPWSQMEEARRMAYEDTAEPMWVGVEKILTRQLLRPLDSDTSRLVRFDRSRIRALQADQLEQATIASMWGRAASLNERRGKMGLEPSDDPKADEIPELTQPDPLAIMAGAGAEEDDEEELEPAEKAEQDKGDAWRLFDLESKSFEPRWEGALVGYLFELRQKAVHLARRVLEEEKGHTKAGPVRPNSGRSFQLQFDALIDQSKPRLKSRTFPLILETGGAAVKRLSSRIGLSFSVLEPGLLQYATERAGFLVDVMGKTTGEAVATAVSQGLEAGETIAAMVKRLESLPAFDRTRAKLVARTETTAAWNGAQRRALSQYQASTGKQALKTWLSSRDDRVRPEHVDLDGESQPIDAAFSNGLLEPGEPNCRCTLTYSFVDSAGREAEVTEEAPE